MATKNTAANAADKPSTEIARDSLKGMVEAMDGNFNAVLSAMFDAGETIIAAEAIPDQGDGYVEMSKDSLVGIPFLIVEWEERVGDIKGDDGTIQDYVGVRVLLRDGRKGYFSTGGTLGMATQLMKITEETGRNSGVFAEYGLDYFVTKKYGKRTYFLAKQPVNPDRIRATNS